MSDPNQHPHQRRESVSGRPSLGDLRSQPYDSGDYLRFYMSNNNTASDFHAWSVIATNAHFPDPSAVPLRYESALPAPLTTSSSMRVQPDWQSQAGSQYGPTPSLSNGTTASSSRASTFERQGLHVAVGRMLDEEGRVLRHRVPCDFYFLGCQEMLQPGEEWHTHSKSHFRHHPPPQYVYCPFRYCPWTVEVESGHRSWEFRRQHINRSHGCAGEFKRIEPYFAMYLLQKGLVDGGQFQSLIRDGHAHAGPPYATINRNR